MPGKTSTCRSSMEDIKVAEWAVGPAALKALCDGGVQPPSHTGGAKQETSQLKNENPSEVRRIKKPFAAALIGDVGTIKQENPH